ncbi:MAG: hypothetical protein GX029_00320 [Pseudomonadaceae bacterium]|nr:hypothetical protein [Pseudomonadaceae bacterium]
MIKYLPLVIFSHQNQLFALEATFVRGQGRVEFLAAGALLLPFAQLLTPKTLVPFCPVGSPSLVSSSSLACPLHWLGLAGGQLSTASGQQNWLLGIEGEAELVELPVEQIQPLPPLLLARRTFPALQAAAWYQQRLVSLIDARVLLTLAPPLLTSVTPDASLVE